MIAPLVFVGLFLGCSEYPTAPQESPSATGALSLGVRARPQISIEEEFDEISRESPDFAGVYLDELGIPVVMKVGAQPNEALRSRAVARVAAKSGAFSAISVSRVRQAEYSFAQLSEFRAVLRDIVVRLNAQAGIGIDIQKNLVSIRGAEAAINRVGVAAVERGVPTRAFELTVDSFVAGVSLRGVVRPVTGGLSISYVSDAGTYCSAGLQAWKNDSLGNPDVSQGRFILTASHCTDNLGVVTGVTFGQPHRGHGHHATEVWDAPLFTGGSCAYGFTPCQLVDVAVLKMVDSVSSTWQRVAKSNTSNPPTYLGQVSLNTSVWSAVQGQTVRRVGARTGQRDGEITKTCFDLPVAGRYLLCQVEVEAYSNGGDSGGPVYVSASAQYPDAPWRSGIYHSYNQGLNSHYWFSSVGAILSAFGGAFTI